MKSFVAHVVDGAAEQDGARAPSVVISFVDSVAPLKVYAPSGRLYRAASQGAFQSEHNGHEHPGLDRFLAIAGRHETPRPYRLQRGAVEAR